MKDFSVLIPALNPTESLIEYVRDLLNEEIPQIVVINDGSKEACQHIFTELNNFPRCTILTHEINKGKGQSLKTGFQYLLGHCSVSGIVTADADGQHSVEDVIKVGEALHDFQEGIILGVRNFHDANVPFRSYLGNTITSSIFGWLFKVHLKDTQTGLRGIPKKMLVPFTSLRGKRYEYEMNMLIEVSKRNLKIAEIPIHTLYFDNNKSSYYHPIKDSFIILRIIISGYFRKSNNTTVSR